MVAIGMGLVFAAYAAGMYGYCLVRGYNVTFAELFGSKWPQNATASTASATTAA